MSFSDDSVSAASKGSIFVFDKNPADNSVIVFESSEGAHTRNKAVARMRIGFKSCAL